MTSLLLWQDENWLKQAHTWIESETKRHSITINGAFEQPHIYAWSTVIHIPTNEGKLFFKAAATETIFESALMQILASIKEEYIPNVLSVDLKRGWILMRDGGEQLRASIRPTKNITAWHSVLPKFSSLQIESIPYIQKLLDIGVPDYRLHKLPGLLTEILKDDEILLIDKEKGLTSSELQQLREIIPHFELVCKKLTAFGIPESLNHGDFHDGNVLVQNGNISLIDWGDASISHPFVSLRTLFVSIEIALDLEDYSFTPEMNSLLENYLQAWASYAPINELKNAYQISKPVASVVKALNWNMTVSPLKGDLRAEYEHIVPSVLQEFLYHMQRTDI